MIDAGEVRLRAAVQGSGPLVLFVHGFPESWYSWRHQLQPVAAAGFTACAIDVRGYGGSDKPHDVSAYAMERLVADIVGVADALSPGEPAILVGHDWGAPMVWNSALVRPERFRAVAGLSVPFTGVPQRSMSQMIRERYTSKGLFFYQEYFQAEGVAEAEAEADPRKFVRIMLYAISGDAPVGRYLDKSEGTSLLEGLPDPQVLPAWLTEADLDFYEGEFRRSGFRGPLNRYRNHDRDYAWLQAFKGRRIEQPSLFIGGTRDPASTIFGAIPDPVATTRRSAPKVEAHMLEGAGHWTQQERPAEVNRLLLDWLARL